MRPIEQEILATDKPGQLFEKLIESPLGLSSPEFLDHKDMKYVFNYDYGDTGSYLSPLKIWFWIEVYLVNKNDQLLAPEKLAHIEKFLNKQIKPNTQSNHELLPKIIVNPRLIRNIYLSNDNALISLFSKYLPRPKAQLFQGFSTPDFIAQELKESKETVEIFLTKQKTSLNNTETSVIKIQRILRAKRRKREYLKIVSQNIYDSERKDEDTRAEQIIINANKAYVPQKCDPSLVERIVRASRQVKLFSTIRHITRLSSLKSILDDGLYGRQTLLKFFMSFKEAALNSYDCENGDANVICLGPQEIDPKSLNGEQGIELKFNLDKLDKNNPCIFFKQMDFGYNLRAMNVVKVGKHYLHFSATEAAGLFQLSRLLDFVSVPGKFSVISNNLYDIHQILTMNFFRYIDSLELGPDANKSQNFSHVEKKIQEIYAAFVELNEEELIAALKEIGLKMSVTSEFNFYGAHKISFDTLISIAIVNHSSNHPKSKNYELILSDFIQQLEAGSLAAIHDAKQKIPELLSSYRFLDYLLENVSNENVRLELLKEKNNCVLPYWYSREIVKDPHPIKRYLQP